MRKYSFIFLFICNFQFAVCNSQNVIIKGKVDSSYLAEEKNIFVYAYDDFISYKDKELANSQLDEKGNFNLSFPIQNTLYVFLMVGNAKAEMAVEPNKTYDINFLKKDSDAVNTFSMSVPVELQFNNSDQAELNYLMADFTSRYESFLEDHRGMIAKKDSKIFGKIDTLKMLSQKKYTIYNNAYLNNYIEYTFASLEESISLKGDENIFKKYIDGKAVQLSNYDYMNFFNQFYSGVASSFISKPQTQIEIAKQNFVSLMEYYKQNKFLANDTIREAVILKSLAEARNYPDIKINSVLAILEQAGKQCKADENRRAAENLKKKLSVMNVGKQAPLVYFQDVNGKSVSLASYLGKYVYLNFWASWCESCTQEMALIPELKKMYGSKITFVSISADKNMDAMKNFVKKNPKMDWNFLYCDNYKKAKEEFNVLTVPTYYLIDPKGNVLKSPASSPVDIEPLFLKIKKKQQ